jgi:hypothetical protein
MSIMYLVVVAIFAGAGGALVWFYVRSRVATLADLIIQIRGELEQLGPTDAQRVATVEQNEERTRLAYQQAADWVKLANNVTWTMSSIYLVGSLLALNGSLTQQLINTPWRPWVGIAVVGLSFIWLAFDLIYSCSARSARNWLAATEARWVTEAQFFSSQNSWGVRVGRWAVAILLWISICVPAALGLFVAKPILPTCLGSFFPDIK